MSSASTLGGDSEHSILVKGLDFSLLEQNKARSVMTNEDVDALDEAYKEASSQERIIPTKRTREDIIRELRKRGELGKEDEKGFITKLPRKRRVSLKMPSNKGSSSRLGSSQ